MPTPERVIQHQVRLALGNHPDLLLWRNEVGVGVVGRGATSQKVRFGLINGASDLIGLLTLKAGDLDPSTPIARFVAVELKNEVGQLSPDQQRFLSLVRQRGGVGAVVRSVDAALEALDRWRAGAQE